MKLIGESASNTGKLKTKDSKGIRRTCREQNRQVFLCLRGKAARAAPAFPERLPRRFRFWKNDKFVLIMLRQMETCRICPST